jgi:acyl-CoA reductase-like NAD-dependent aldehyde dehydrogenase
MGRVKLAIALALKAKRTWDRVPPEQRQKLVEGAATQVKKHGPTVAKAVAGTAKTRGPLIAKKLADTARDKGPVVAKRVSETLDRTLNKPPKGS